MGSTVPGSTPSSRRFNCHQWTTTKRWRGGGLSGRILPSHFVASTVPCSTPMIDEEVRTSKSQCRKSTDAIR